MTTYYKPFGATTYNLSGSISSTATSIVLSSFLEPVTGTPYTMALLDTQIAFGTIAPKTTSSEFISFTGITQNANGTATLTGVTRGLAKKSPFTTDSAYKLPHSGQSQFIISDAPQVFYEYPAKNNDETITGQWTFSTFPVTPSNSDASTTVKGVTKLSVAPASATSPIAVGTNDDRVLVGYAVDSVGTDAYAITPSPAITAYSAGQVFTFKAGTANTGAATLNVSGLGAKTIKKNVSTDLATGDILLNQIVMVEYDGTNMQLLSKSSLGTTTPTTQIFTSTGANTYTAPANLVYAVVEVQGGGGGGSVQSGGGGGGGYSKRILTAAQIGVSQTATVGTGGGADTNGGNSSFGALAIGNGGVKGTATSGAGGTASAGDINITGGNGGQGPGGAVTIGGMGGNSVLGHGGGNTAFSSSSVGGYSIAATGYGGGGGGTATGSSGSPAGASGTNGIIIVTEFY